MKYMKKLFIFILHVAALFFTPDVTYFNIHKRLSGITVEEFAPISLQKKYFWDFYLSKGTVLLVHVFKYESCRVDFI